MFTFIKLTLNPSGKTFCFTFKAKVRLLSLLIFNKVNNDPISDEEEKEKNCTSEPNLLDQQCYYQGAEWFIRTESGLLSLGRVKAIILNQKKK